MISFGCLHLYDHVSFYWNLRLIVSSVQCYTSGLHVCQINSCLFVYVCVCVLIVMIFMTVMWSVAKCSVFVCSVSCVRLQCINR